MPLNTIAIVNTDVFKQPILTKWWNYKNFVQIWYSYLRYTDRLLDVIFLSYRKQYKEEFTWGTSLDGYTSFLCHFFLLFLHRPPPHPTPSLCPPFPPPVHPASKSRINDGFIYRGRVTTRVAIRKVWMLENMTIRLFCSLHLNW